MAIAKMQKFNVLTFIADKDNVLKAIQSLQKTELFSTRFYYDEVDTNTLFTGVSPSDDLDKVDGNLSKINWTLKFLESYVSPPSIIEKLRTPQKKYTFAEIDEIFQQCEWLEIYQGLQADNNHLKKLEQQRQLFLQEEDNLNIWQYFDEKPQSLQKLKYSQGELGTISIGQLEYFEQGFQNIKYGHYEVVYRSNTTAYLYVVYHKEQRNNVRSLYQQTGFTTYKYPFVEKPSAELIMLKKRLEEIASEEKTIKENLASMNDTYEQLKVVAENFANQKIRENISTKLMRTDNLLSISGWISKTDSSKLVRAIEIAVGENYYLDFKEIDEKQDDILDIPIKLENNDVVKPFESFVEMYSLPRYDEVDPTPLIAPFYIVFFGMMAADFGYGVILFLATTFARLFLKFDEGMKQNLFLFQILSIPTMFWGLVYGSFLGFELPFRLLSLTENVNEILAMAIFFGVIQILTGLIVKFYILWQKQKQLLKAFLQAGTWFFLLISLFVFAGNMFFIQNPLIQTITTSIMIACLLGIIVGNGMDEKTLGAKIGNGLYGLMDITSYVGDIISYSRLMALGIAGGCIASAFNLIVSFLPPIARFTVGIALFLILHGLNLFLSFLGAYVHGIRLQYVEFFGKFYTGGGRAFVPFKTYEQFIKMKELEEN
jgi:Archaeal/vacuolar-type H+-ATPase subunit I